MAAWTFVSAVLLVVSLVSADPHQGYDYLPPSIPFNPVGECSTVTSVVYSTNVQQSVIPTTSVNVQTQYTTTVVYSERVVPTTLYKTHYETQVQYQTSYVERVSKVYREEVVTSKRQANPVVETKYVVSTRVVPQVSYVVKEKVKTRVVPVEKTRVRYETRYEDQVQYQTVPVQKTSVVRIPGKNVVRTTYRTKIQSSVVQRQEPAQTKYRATTLVKNEVDTQTVPSPPVVQTLTVHSQRVVPKHEVKTRYEVVYNTETKYVTQTTYRTQTKVQTQYVPQEVITTVDVRREVVQTVYSTQVVPRTEYQTRYHTQTERGYPVVKTKKEYATSVVRVPGEDRVVRKEVTDTKIRQQVVYKTENVQRPVEVTETVTVPCSTATGYSYPRPQIKFNF